MEVTHEYEQNPGGSGGVLLAACQNIQNNRGLTLKRLSNLLFPGEGFLKYFYRPWSEGDNVIGSVRLSVRPSFTTLTAEPFDLRPWCLVCRLTLTLARLGLYVKVVGQGQMPKIVFWHHCYPALRSKSKVGVKVKVKFLVRSGRY